MQTNINASTNNANKKGMVRTMEKVLKAIMVIAIIVLIALILVTVGYSKIKYDGKDNMSATTKAVVVKANEKNLAVMELEGTNSLLYVGLQNAGDMVFKQGQEILIYFDGIILTTYPGQLSNVGKIEILKEKSNVKIPEEVLRTFYSSSKNVKISVSKLTNTGISFAITDTNQYPYSYANTYTIYKKNKQAENINIKPVITEPATSNSVPPYMGTGQVLWEEANKISNVAVENTVKQWDNGSQIGKICDWTNVYGELGSGEYEFVLTSNQAFTVRIEFSINENGEVVIVENAGVNDATNQPIAKGEIILFTGVYGGLATKANVNTIKGKCVDIYGNVYEYKIPCDENEEMLIPVDEIDKNIVEKYKADYLYTLSKEELDSILNNMKNVSGEYEKTDRMVIDAPSSFAYIVVNGKKKEITTINHNTIKENTSEEGKNILSVIVKNNMIYNDK